MLTYLARLLIRWMAGVGLSAQGTKNVVKSLQLKVKAFKSLNTSIIIIIIIIINWLTTVVTMLIPDYSPQMGRFLLLLCSLQSKAQWQLDAAETPYWSIQWNAVLSSGILCNSEKSIAIQILFATQWNSMWSSEVYCIPVKCLRIQWNLLISSEILCNPEKSIDIQWNTLWSSEIYGTPLKWSAILGNLLKSS